MPQAVRKTNISGPLTCHTSSRALSNKNSSATSALTRLSVHGCGGLVGVTKRCDAVLTCVLKVDHVTMARILFYREGDEYGFMSNFYRSPIALAERVWPTTEHYFQVRILLELFDHLQRR